MVIETALGRFEKGANSSVMNFAERGVNTPFCEIHYSWGQLLSEDECKKLQSRDNASQKGK